MKRILGCVVVVSALVGWAPGAWADAIYAYQGNPFQSAVSPYDTSDFLSGTMTLNAPLAPNLTDVNIAASILSIAFTDGVETFDTNLDARVSTDGSGAIVAWAIDGFDSGSPNNAKNFIYTCSGGLANNTGDCVSEGSLDATGVIDLVNGGQSVFASNEGTPGVWTLVPEPSTALLLTSGLALLSLSLRGRAAAAQR